ncbi:MAG: methionyl-tRNA formyltransferase [Verrucomicrobiia bacterium]
MPRLRTIFFGTADLAVPSLLSLQASSDMEVLAVVTQPDRPKGRELKTAPPPVKTAALQANLPVLQPERARNPDFVRHLADLQPDLIVVAAYGQILPPAILELPRFGCVNVHASLLPKLRGAAPIQWCILNDDAETGVTIMKMDAGLDTGDILTQSAIPIEPTDNAQSLHDKLASLGADLLVKTIPDYISGQITPRKQPDEGATYARKITKEDGKLAWNQPARSVWNRIRAFTPWPGAWTFMPADPRPVLLKIWEAEVGEPASAPAGEVLAADKSGILVACADRALRIVRLQREGGRRLNAAEFLAGHKILPGQRFSTGTEAAG